jgi:hypothetical protein
MIIDKVTAILSLRPNAEFHLAGDTLTWQDTQQTQPTEEEINTELTRLQAEYDAKQYARDRQNEYPAIGDQLDALFHAGVFPDDMAAQIQAVKDKYPKG